MRAQQAHAAIHLDVDLDEGGRPGDPGAQIVGGGDLGVRQRDLADLFAFVVGQLAVHQLDQGQARQLRRGIDDPDADGGAEQRIEDIEAKDAAQHQRRDDAAVEDQIAAIVQFVGGDRDRAGAAHDMPLIEDQRHRHRDRKHHDRDACRRVMHRGRRDHPAHRLGQQQQRAADDERRLAEHGERLGLAVAKAMLAIGRGHRMAHREQIDDRGDEVEQRVDQARQQRHRAGIEPGREFDRDQHHGDGDRGIGRPAPQPVRRRPVDQGKSRSRRHPSPSRTNNQRSCRREGRSCQNSIRCGITRKPDQ